jgi:signal transduction histidine kinase
VRRRRSLYRRVYLHGVLLLVVLVVALSAVGLLIRRDPRFRLDPVRHAERVARLVKTVPADVAPPLVILLADELDVDAAVYGPDGQRLVSVGANPPKALPPREAAELLSTGTYRPEGHRYASARVDTGRYLRIRSRGDPHTMFLRGLAMLAVIALVLALVSMPFARAIARPLEHLSGVARRWGAGDLAARAHLDRRDEIGELARTFDETAERVGSLLAGQRELLANVSHELRTPLSRMRVSLALAAEASPEDAPRHLAAIESDADELERLVADLLTTSRLDAGGSLSLQRAPADLGALVEQALARMARLHPGRVVERQVQAVPAVSVEAGLIARVLDNVLDNAAKYSEADKPIAVALEPVDNGVRVTVRDQGIGIALEDHARVFAAFFRSDRSRARDTGGAGLGLTLSKKIVDAHGGRITVDSRPGEGTALAVWLPA